jgi:hypothetical protein
MKVYLVFYRYYHPDKGFATREKAMEYIQKQIERHPNKRLALSDYDIEEWEIEE